MSKYMQIFALATQSKIIKDKMIKQNEIVFV